MTGALIRCTPWPWSCAFTCSRCGHEATVSGPHPTSNHRAILAEAAAHCCPEA